MPLLAMRTCRLEISSHICYKLSYEPAYILNDCVAIVRLHKIPHFARRRCAEIVAADEVGSQIMLCGVGARIAVHVACAIDTIRVGWDIDAMWRFAVHTIDCSHGVGMINALITQVVEEAPKSEFEDLTPALRVRMMIVRRAE